MSKEVYTLVVNPQMLADDPKATGELLGMAVAEHPDAFWIVLIADRKEAGQFMETQFFHFRPPEALGETPDSDSAT